MRNFAKALLVPAALAGGVAAAGVTAPTPAHAYQDGYSGSGAGASPGIGDH